METARKITKTWVPNFQNILKSKEKDDAPLTGGRNVGWDSVMPEETENVASDFRDKLINELTLRHEELSNTDEITVGIRLLERYDGVLEHNPICVNVCQFEDIYNSYSKCMPTILRECPMLDQSGLLPKEALKNQSFYNDLLAEHEHMLGLQYFSYDEEDEEEIDGLSESSGSISGNSLSFELEGSSMGPAVKDDVLSLTATAAVTAATAAAAEAGGAKDVDKHHEIEDITSDVPECPPSPTPQSPPVIVERSIGAGDKTIAADSKEDNDDTMSDSPINIDGDVSNTSTRGFKYLDSPAEDIVDLDDISNEESLKESHNEEDQQQDEQPNATAIGDNTSKVQVAKSKIELDKATVIKEKKKAKQMSEEEEKIPTFRRFQTVKRLAAQDNETRTVMDRSILKEGQGPKSVDREEMKLKLRADAELEFKQQVEKAGIRRGKLEKLLQQEEERKLKLMNKCAEVHGDRFVSPQEAHKMFKEKVSRNADLGTGTA